MEAWWSWFQNWGRRRAATGRATRVELRLISLAFGAPGRDVLHLKLYRLNRYFLIHTSNLGRAKAFHRSRFFGAATASPSPGPHRGRKPSQFDRHEAKRFVGASGRLPGVKDNAGDTTTPHPAFLGHRPPSLGCGGTRRSPAACQAILGNGGPGRDMAGAQSQPQEEDDEGSAPSADGGIIKGYHGGLG